MVTADFFVIADFFAAMPPTNHDILNALAANRNRCALKEGRLRRQLAHLHLQVVKTKRRVRHLEDQVKILVKATKVPQIKRKPKAEAADDESTGNEDTADGGDVDITTAVRVTTVSR